MYTAPPQSHSKLSLNSSMPYSSNTGVTRHIESYIVGHNLVQTTPWQVVGILPSTLLPVPIVELAKRKKLYYGVRWNLRFA